MTIPNPSLHDKSFSDFFQMFLRNIPKYSKTWTNHNYSDPGITLLELFAWLGDSYLYSLDQLSAKHYLSYLKLLGFEPKNAMPTRAMVKFDVHSFSFSPLIIPKGTVIQSEQFPDYHLETDRDFKVTPMKISKLMTFSRNGTSNTLEDINIKEMNWDVYAFDVQTPENSGFCIGFESEHIIESDIELFICVYNEDMDFPYWENDYFDDKTTFQTNTKIQWECAKMINGKLSWHNVSVKDQTYGFTKNGYLTISALFAENDRLTLNQSDSKLFWVRCTLINNDYLHMPKIRIISTNVCSVTQGTTITEECTDKFEQTWKSNGFSKQTIRLKNHSIFKINNTTSFLKSEKTSWKHVNDLNHSKPDDTHFEFDSENSVILFGDDINGCAPAKNSTFQVRYTYGKPDIALQKGFTFDGKKFEKQNSDVNVLPITIDVKTGSAPETLFETISRCRAEMKIPTIAATSKDIIHLAKNTPNLRVCHVIVQPNTKNNEIIDVIVIPHSKSISYHTPKWYLDAIKNHLDLHKPLTLQFNVLAAQFIKVSVITKIRVNKNNIKAKIQQKIDSFLSPTQQSSNNPLSTGKILQISDIIKEIKKVQGVSDIEDIRLSINDVDTSLYSIINGDLHFSQKVKNCIFTCAGEHTITILDSTTGIEVD